MAGLAGQGETSLRRLLRSTAGLAIGARLGAGYIRLVDRTTRWTVEGAENLCEVLSGEQGFIAAIWHGRLFMAPTFAPPGRDSLALISQSRDGDQIAAIIKRFGIGAVRGSTYDREKRRDKGGRAAYARAAEALLHNRAALAVTPDGPRGPRMRAQAGAARLSLSTGCPILPVAFSTTWGRLFDSWDRFLLPLPLGRGAIVYGPPLWPPERTGAGAVELFRSRLEQALTEVTNRADELCGRAPVPAAAMR